jgi:transcriptional regulator with XRE-family HTH domain
MRPNFDSWDLTPVALPVRSRLHSIEPIGIGTPFVESLTGYMIRLAAAHAVRVSDLIEYELRTSIPYFHSAAKIPNAINGVNESARNWVSALERFTLRDNLQMLTLLPFASLLKTPLLIRRERAWCPRCYESRKAQGQDVYEQLLWSLQPVEICPLHNTPLETSCPTCHRRLRPLRAVSRPGLCSWCHQWLGVPQPPIQKEGQTDYQAWIAQQFGQLLERAPHAQPVGKENLQKVLVGYVDSFSEGNRSAIAETAGCRRTSFRSWYNGASVARVDLLLRMCHELGVPLTSLVTGTIAIEPEAAARAEVATQARRRHGLFPRRNTDQIRAALLLASDEQPAPSINEVARRLGYTTPNRLYVADSNLCRLIVRNFNKSGRSHWWRRRGGKFLDDSVIRKALEESLAIEMPVPVNRSAKSLGFETESPLTARFPDLCLAIKAKRTNVQAARRITVASALEAALSEDPPPTVEQIAARLGYANEGTIRIWSPRLCARLIARRQRFAEHSKKALKKRMKAMLKENPPPSLRDVYARLGITRAISYGNFPRIHCAISTRHREFRRRTKSVNRVAPSSPGV